MAESVSLEYEASLKELKMNSKPHINMLTMLADENKQYAANIVRLIERRLEKAKGTEKLPIIYLMDSVIKNVKGGPYLALFSKKIVKNFSMVFEQGDEKIRTSLFKLRSTWNDYFGNDRLYALDVRVKQLDPAWPVMATAPATQQQVPSASIHVNPKFIKKKAAVPPTPAQPRVAVVVAPTMGVKQQPVVAPKGTPKDPVKDLQLKEQQMRSSLVAKQQELLQIHKQRLELELQQTKARLQEQAFELERKNIELQRQKILAQQQQQVFAAQAQLATPAVAQLPIGAPPAPVVPAVAPAVPPVAPAVATATPAVVPPASVVTSATPVAQVAPRSTAGQTVAAGVAKSNYSAASAGWGSTQVTPPQPGTEQQPKTLFGAKRDPRTAARKDPRLARDPRLKGPAATSTKPAAPKAHPKKKAPSKGVPTHPVKPVIAKVQHKPDVPSKDPKKLVSKPVPPGGSQHQVNVPAAAGTVPSQMPRDPRLKTKPMLQNKAVVPPVKRKEPPTANKENITRKEAKVDRPGPTPAGEDLQPPAGKPKKDAEAPAPDESPRDGSRSPRGKPAPSKGDKHKVPEPRRSDRLRRPSHRSRSRSRSPSRRSSKYEGRPGSRRRGSDERDRREDRSKPRDRTREERDPRERRDISKLGRIPRKSDTRNAEERRPGAALKRKSPPRDRRGPDEEVLRGVDPAVDAANKRGRFERMDLLERFPDRGHSVQERGRGVEPEHTGPGRPHHQMVEVSPNSQTRRRSSIDPSVVVPKELSRDKLSAVIAQADRQLHLGQLTHEEHQKLLGQLEDLYQFQKGQEDELHPPPMGRTFNGPPGMEGPLLNPPLLDRPTMDRPPMDQPLIDRTDIYNYRLRGGTITKEQELPESDDSYFTGVAKKMEKDIGQQLPESEDSYYRGVAQKLDNGPDQQMEFREPDGTYFRGVADEIEGVPVKEVELPESDDSYFTGVAMKMQERMSLPKSIPEAAVPLSETPLKPEPPVQENPFGFPVNEDVDLRMLDPSYQRMLRQKAEEEARAAAGNKVAPVEQGAFEVGSLRQVSVSKEAALQNNLPPRNAQQEKPVQQSDLLSKETAQTDGIVKPTETVLPQGVAQREETVPHKDPVLPGKKSIPEKETIPPKKALLDDNKSPKSSLKKKEKKGVALAVASTHKSSPRAKDSTVRVTRSKRKALTKAAADTSVLISPQSPPPEDRDERLTAVVGKKSPDEDTPAVKETKEIALKAETKQVRILEKKDGDVKQEPSKEDVDERMNISGEDKDERVNISKAGSSDNLAAMKDPVETVLVKNLDGKQTAATLLDVDDRNTSKEEPSSINLGVEPTGLGKPAEAKLLVPADVDDRNIVDMEVEETASGEDSPQKQMVQNTQLKQEAPASLAVDVDRIDNKDVDYRDSTTKVDLIAPPGDIDARKVGEADTINRKTSVSDTDERIPPQTDINVSGAKGESGSHSETTELVREVDIDERKPLKENLQAGKEEDTDLRAGSVEQPAPTEECQDVDLRVLEKPVTRADSASKKNKIAESRDVDQRVGAAVPPAAAVSPGDRKGEVLENMDVDLREGQMEQTGGIDLTDKTDDETLKDVDMRTIAVDATNDQKSANTLGTTSAAPQVKTTAPPESVAEGVAGEDGNDVAGKHDVDQREKPSDGGTLPEAAEKVEDTSPEGKTTTLKIKRKKSMKGKGQQLRYARRQKLRIEKLQMKKEAFLKEASLKEQLLKEEALKQERLKRGEMKLEELRQERLKELELDAAAAEKERMLRALEQQTKVDPAGGEADLLPAAFRDATEPQVADQDLRDIDARLPLADEHTDRARSWRDVPTDFFNEEGKREEEASELKQDVDLRNLGPRLHHPPLPLPPLPPPPAREFPTRLREPPPMEQLRSRDLERSRMPGPRGIPRWEHPPGMEQRFPQGPLRHGREGSPYDEGHMGSMRQRHPPPPDQMHRYPMRHAGERDDRRPLDDAYTRAEFPGMDPDSRFPRDRRPPREARFDELGRPLLRDMPMIDRQSPRNSPGHFPDHLQELPPPHLLPAGSRSMGPPIMEGGRHGPPVRMGEEGPPILVKEQSFEGVTHNPNVVMPGQVPHPPNIVLIRLPRNVPPGHQVMVRLPGQAPQLMTIRGPHMEGVPTMPPPGERMRVPVGMDRMPAQSHMTPYVEGIPLHPQGMPGPSHFVPVSGPPHGDPALGHPHMGQVPPRPHLIPGPRYVRPPELREVQAMPSGQPLPTYVPTPPQPPLPPAPAHPVLPTNEQPQSTLKSQVDINDLLKRLMTSGILSKPQSPAHEATTGAAGTPPPVGEREGGDESQTDKQTAMGQPKKIQKDNTNQPLPEETQEEVEGEDEEAKPKKKKKQARVKLPEEFNLPSEKLVVPPLALGTTDLKQRIPGVIYSIISGTQCSSCGMRFSIEHMVDYRKHLDWHFRQNRRDRDGVRAATWRRWHYELDEWMLYEEIDATEEEYSRSAFFDQQVVDPSSDAEQTEGVPVTGVEEDEYCKVCQEPFEQYWDEDDETWMLRDAIKIDNKTYHPACYGDLKSASIFEEPSGEFHGIPGVTDEDNVPGIDAETISGDPEIKQEEKESTQSQAEEAKTKLAEILKPPQESIKVEEPVEAEMKMEVDHEVEGEPLPKQGTPKVTSEEGPSMKADTSAEETDTVSAAPETLSEKVKTEEVTVKLELVHEEAAEPSEVPVTTEEEKHVEVHVRESKPDVESETTSSEDTSAALVVGSEVSPIIGTPGVDVKDQAEASEPMELEVTVEGQNIKQEKAVSPPQVDATSEQEESSSLAVIPAMADEEPQPPVVMGSHLLEQDVVSESIGDSQLLEESTMHSLSNSGGNTPLADEVDMEPPPPGELMGGVILGSAFPGGMADDDDENAGFSRIFVDFIDDDDDLMPMAGVSSDFHPEPYVPDGHDPVDGPMIIHPQEHRLAAGMEGEGMPVPNILPDPQESLPQSDDMPQDLSAITVGGDSSTVHVMEEPAGVQPVATNTGKDTDEITATSSVLASAVVSEENLDNTSSAGLEESQEAGKKPEPVGKPVGGLPAAEASTSASEGELCVEESQPLSQSEGEVGEKAGDNSSKEKSDATQGEDTTLETTVVTKSAS